MASVEGGPSTKHGKSPDGGVLPPGQERALGQVLPPGGGPPGLQLFAIHPNNGDEENKELKEKSNIKEEYSFENLNQFDKSQSSLGSLENVQTDASGNLGDTSKSNNSKVSTDPYDESYRSTDERAQGTPHGRADDVRFMTPAGSEVMSPDAACQNSAGSVASTYIYDSTLKERLQEAQERAQGGSGVATRGGRSCGVPGRTTPASSPILPSPTESPSEGPKVNDAKVPSDGKEGNKGRSLSEDANKRNWELDSSLNPRGTKFWRSECTDK